MLTVKCPICGHEFETELKPWGPCLLCPIAMLLRCVAVKCPKCGAVFEVSIEEEKSKEKQDKKDF